MELYSLLLTYTVKYNAVFILTDKAIKTIKFA